MDKLGSVGLVPVGRLAAYVELAPAMMLLASSGEIVEVEDGSDEGSVPEEEVGGGGVVELPAGEDLIACMIESAVVSMKAMVGPIMISCANCTC